MAKLYSGDLLRFKLTNLIWKIFLKAASGILVKIIYNDFSNK